MLAEINTILYATDLGKNTRPAFRVAVSLATRYDAKIEFLHVIEPLGPNAEHLVDAYLPNSTVAEIRAKGADELRGTLRQRIDKFCEEEMPEGGECKDISTSPRLEEGPIASTILAVADEINADLIVMGSHTHSAIGEFLLGSVANKVMHMSKRPVLLVPLKD